MADGVRVTGVALVRADGMRADGAVRLERGEGFSPSCQHP